MKTIVVASQKGGVAKTSTSIALSSILHALGKKTLLIDADSSANATDTYGASIDGCATIYDVLLGRRRVPIADAVQKTEYGDIVAGDPELENAEPIFASDLKSIFRLKESLAEVTDYDYVIIDTHPSIDRTLYNCLIAADEVVIPVGNGRYSFKGFARLYEAIKYTQENYNNDLKIAGLLITNHEERVKIGRQTKEDLSELSKMLNTKLFSLPISHSSIIPNSQADRIPLAYYTLKNNVGDDYINFVSELTGIKKIHTKLSKKGIKVRCD